MTYSMHNCLPDSFKAGIKLCANGARAINKITIHVHSLWSDHFAFLYIKKDILLYTFS